MERDVARAVLCHYVSTGAVVTRRHLEVVARAAEMDTEFEAELDALRVAFELREERRRESLAMIAELFEGRT